MNAIYITKSNLRATSWDSDLRQDVDCPIPHPFHCLRLACHIEPNVTLKDIIRLVAQSPDLSKLVGEYSWADVQAFAVEVEKPTLKKSDLSYIEISKSFELGDPSPGYETLDVHGIDEKEPEALYALDFTPVNELADLPVRLNPNISIQDWRIIEDGEVKIEKFETCFSLLEILTEIFFEISFHGSPQSRDERSGELQEMVKEIEDGTAKLVPFDLGKYTIQ
jgi:hypothetical protein